LNHSSQNKEGILLSSNTFQLRFAFVIDLITSLANKFMSNCSRARIKWNAGNCTPSDLDITSNMIMKPKEVDKLLRAIILTFLPTVAKNSFCAICRGLVIALLSKQKLNLPIVKGHFLASKVHNSDTLPPSKWNTPLKSFQGKGDTS
jgi:hypothetical protein